MSFTDILPLISAIFVFFLGFFVFFKNKKSRVNLAFFLHALAISVWLFGTFMMFISRENTDSAIFWDRFVYAGVVFIPVFMYYFGLAWQNKKADFLLYFGYILSVLFLFLSRTRYFVDDVFVYKWGIHTKAQLFHHIFLLYFIGYVLIWFFKMYRYYKGINLPIHKQQTKYIFFGFFLLFSIGPLAYLPAYGLGIYPFAYVSGVIFTVILTYAIIRHRLMDIKVALRRSTVYLASISVIIIPAAAILYLSDRFYPKSTIAARLAVLILGVSVFPPIRSYFYHLANKYFFSSLYDSGQVISSLTDKLRSTLEPYKIYCFIADALKDAFHCKYIAIFTYDEKSGDYLVQHNDGFAVGGQKRFPNDRLLQERFAKQNKVLVVEEAKKEMEDFSAATLDILIKLGVEILAPLNVKNKTIGLIALSVKESRDMYNNEDLRVLEVVGAQAAISIENSLLYEETKNFSQTLQQEVERQTVVLQKAYEDLKVLDKAKSEFISMASHQLRTPLSAIKGYISMLVDGSYGKLPEKARGKLKNVFESNERLIRVVNDLLDISKIEMGKMELEKEPTQIEDLVQSCYEEMKIGADKKGLKFVFEKPKYSLPKIELDPLKFRQAILNLIDNAIRYTQKGEIEIKVEKVNSVARISVKDTGEGLTAEEQRAVFEGFTRGSAGIAHFVEGAGLGLYVAKKFLGLHHSKIWVESEGKGKGSTFYVELPIR